MPKMPKILPMRSLLRVCSGYAESVRGIKLDFLGSKKICHWEECGHEKICQSDRFGVFHVSSSEGVLIRIPAALIPNVV